MPKYIEHPHYNSDAERDSFNEAVAKTLKQADMSVDEKQKALNMANRNEHLLLLECEKMRDENDKLKKLNSVNVTFHREISEKLDGDL